MKGFFKLIPAALAVFALASCSNDDLLVGDQAPEQNLEMGDLIITYDPLDNAAPVTRGYRQGDFGKELPDGSIQNRPMIYADGDVFKVYDPDMFKYEAYGFNYNGQGNAFFKTNNVTIADPQFVLFPGDKVYRGYYNSDDGCTYAEISIPRVIKYNDKSEKFIDADNTITGYAYNLPMLGIANPLEGGKMGATKMRHLTAILKIDLTNVYGNAMWLRISNQAKKVMSGTIAAKLDVSTDENRKAVKLDPSLNKEDLVTYPDMYVDLRSVPSPQSVIFIPILEGLTEADNIKLEYTAYSGDLDETPGSDWLALVEQGAAGWDTKTNEERWVSTGMEFPGINFKHNNLYEGSHVFKFDEMSPNKISALLGQYKETTTNILIDLSKNLTMDNNDNKVAGNQILLPTMTNNKDVTIKLANTFATITNPGGTETAAEKLVIANADGADFTGTFTLDVSDKLPAGTDLDIEVNVPNGNVVILGDYDNIGGKKLNLVAANSVTIGDATSAAGSTKVTDAKLQLQKLGDNVKAFTIAKSATVEATTYHVFGGKNTAAITVNGTLDGNVCGSEAADAVANVISVGEGATVNGGIVAGNANTSVTVAGAVTGIVTVGEANTLIDVAATGSVGNYILSSSKVENTINIAGPVAGTVYSQPVIGTQYAGWKTDVNITGAGRVGGGIDLAKNLLGTLKIEAVPTSATVDPIVAANVTTGGFVEVNLKADPTAAYKSGEGVAIEGTLTMTGATKELKLIQGYINEIKVGVNNAGDWENKFIKIALNDANQGTAAFAKLTEDQGFAKYTESVWNGEYPTNVNYNKTVASAPASAEKSLYKSAAPNAMFTATQLACYAEYELGSYIHLYNDLDMKSKVFKGMLSPSLPVTFEGKIKNDASDHSKHKIKNLKLYRAEVHTGAGDNHTSAAPMGLFATATQALTIDHIEVTNVEAQTALMPYAVATYTTHTDCGGAIVGVGALVGTASAKVTAKYVDVALKNQNFGFTGTEKGKNFVNVGGLIGYASDGVVIENTNVTGTAPISGYRALGGLIGTAVKGTNDYEFTATTTSVTFNQVIPNDNTMDCWYASVGGFIGLCKDKPNVTLVGTANNAAAITEPFSTKLYVSSTSTSDGNFYNFTRKQNFLGFSGRVPGDADYGFGTVKINGVTQNVPATVPNDGDAKSLYIFKDAHSF